MEQLQKCFQGSSSLNQMKKEIVLFIHMFVFPFDDLFVKRFGKFKKLDEFLIGFDMVLEIGTHKGGIWLKIKQMGFLPKEFSLSIDTNAIPSRYAKPIWQALPTLLDKLIVLCPEIRSDVDFYSSVVE